MKLYHKWPYQTWVWTAFLQNIKATLCSVDVKERKYDGQYPRIKGLFCKNEIYASININNGNEKKNDGI